MGQRKVALATGCYYHVFNRSIAGFEIFRSLDEWVRLRDVLRFYRTSLPLNSFSLSFRSGRAWDSSVHGPARVRVLAYCVMPTHFHLFLEQLVENGISNYLKYVEHSYAVYFNKKIRRLGHLWEAKFKSALVEDDVYALHLIRYIHLNPVSACLVDRPECWEFSSYHEHLERSKGETLCSIKRFSGMSPEAIRRFTEDRAEYQKSLQAIKHLLFD